MPFAYHTFGGWKRSGFGDLNQHGPDSIRSYTKTKTVTARWPSGTKGGAEFVIPTMKRRLSSRPSDASAGIPLSGRYRPRGFVRQHWLHGSPIPG